MKSMLCIAAAAVLLASAMCATATPHLETLFTIPLPGAVTTTPQATESLRGNMFYVGTKAGIVAANFSSKSVAWTANITNPAGPEGGYPSVPIFFRMGDMYACSQTGVYKLDATTGVQKWMTPITPDVFDFFKCNLTFSPDGSKVAAVLASSVMIMDATTGVSTSTMNFKQGFQQRFLTGMSATHGVVLYGIKATSLTGKLTATVLWTGVELWSFASGSPFGFSPFALLPEYLLCTNSTNEGQDISLVVLAASNGTLKLNLGAMNGVAESGFTPKLINGHDLVVVAGLDTPREMTIDLNDGYIIKQIPYSGGGQGPTGGGATYSVEAADINTEIRVTKALKLEVGPIGGPYTMAANFTPSAGSYNLQYYGQGVIQVGNLQGYTMWQVSATTKTAVLIARNEKEPGWKATKGTPITYDGAFIHLLATEIKAEKIVF